MTCGLRPCGFMTFLLNQTDLLPLPHASQTALQLALRRREDCPQAEEKQGPKGTHPPFPVLYSKFTPQINHSVPGENEMKGRNKDKIQCFIFFPSKRIEWSVPPVSRKTRQGEQAVDKDPLLDQTGVRLLSLLFSPPVPFLVKTSFRKNPVKSA